MIIFHFIQYILKLTICNIPFPLILRKPFNSYNRIFINISPPDRLFENLYIDNRNLILHAGMSASGIARALNQ